MELFLPKVVGIARVYFGVQENDRTHLFVDDGRPYLQASTQTYDIIVVDAYQGGPYAPFYIMTQEFFKDTKKHVKPNGFLIVNVFDRGEGEELTNAVANTISTVYAGTYILHVRNNIVFATNAPSNLDMVKEHIAGISTFNTTPIIPLLTEHTYSADEPVFTDDQSSIEIITHGMLKDIE
jgi:hypothetical protein